MRRIKPQFRAGLIGEAFHCLKRCFEIPGDLANYAGDLLLHKMGFQTPLKKRTTYEGLLILCQDLYEKLN